MTSEAEYCSGFLSLSHCVHLLNQNIEFYYNQADKKNIYIKFIWLLNVWQHIKMSEIIIKTLNNIVKRDISIRKPRRSHAALIMSQKHRNRTELNGIQPSFL